MRRAPDLTSQGRNPLCDTPAGAGASWAEEPASASAAGMEPPRGGPRGQEVLPGHLAGPSGHSRNFNPFLQGWW